MQRKPTDEGAKAHFLETFGRIASDDNLPSIAGRIAGMLLLSPEPIAFGRLAEALGVSRASISTNTRLLEKLGTVERVEAAGQREHSFRIAPDASVRTAEWHLRKTREALDLVRSANSRVRSEGMADPVALAQIDAIETFYELWAGQLEVFRDRVIARFSGQLHRK